MLNVPKGVEPSEFDVDNSAYISPVNMRKFWSYTFDTQLEKKITKNILQLYNARILPFGRLSLKGNCASIEANFIMEMHT